MLSLTGLFDDLIAASTADKQPFESLAGGLSAEPQAESPWRVDGGVPRSRTGIFDHLLQPVRNASSQPAFTPGSLEVAVPSPGSSERGERNPRLQLRTGLFDDLFDLPVRGGGEIDRPLMPEAATPAVGTIPLGGGAPGVRWITDVERGPATGRFQTGESAAARPPGSFGSPIEGPNVARGSNSPEQPPREYPPSRQDSVPVGAVDLLTLHQLTSLPEDALKSPFLEEFSRQAFGYTPPGWNSSDVDPDLPKIEAEFEPTIGTVGQAISGAYSGHQKPVSPRINFSNDEIPVTQPDGSVRYEYKPLGDRITREGLFAPLAPTEDVITSMGLQADPRDSPGMDTAKGVGRAVVGILNGLTSPVGAPLMFMGAGEVNALRSVGQGVRTATADTILNSGIPQANRAAAGTFSAQMGASLPEQVDALTTAKTPGETAERLVNLGATAAFTGAGLAGAAHPVRVENSVPRPTVQNPLTDLDRIRAALKSESEVGFSKSEAIRRSLQSEVNRSVDANPYRDQDGRLLISPKAPYAPNARLSAMEVRMKLLADNAEKADKIYNSLPETFGGKVIGTDQARELLDSYRGNPSGRMENVKATARVAKAYAKDRLWREISNPGERRHLAFTAGGVAVGKSSVVKSLAESSDLVFDGTLREVPWAIEAVQLARKHGWAVQIQYVQRPMDLVIEGAIERAQHEGRWGPLISLPKTHQAAQQAILKIADAFREDPHIKINYWLNEGTKINRKPTSSLELSDIAHGGEYSYDTPHGRGRRAVASRNEREFQAGFSEYWKGRIRDKFREAVESRRFDRRVLEGLAEGSPELQEILSAHGNAPGSGK